MHEQQKRFTWVKIFSLHTERRPNVYQEEKCQNQGMIPNNAQAWVHRKKSSAENTAKVPAWYTSTTAPKDYNTFKWNFYICVLFVHFY